MTAIRSNWSESKLQTELIARAKELGWMVQHSRRSTITRKDGSFVHATPISGHVGFPDLALVRRGRIAFLELKSEKGQVDDAQVAWLNALCDFDVSRQGWRSRDAVPDGRAFHAMGGWTPTDVAGDWTLLAAVIRPRHYGWAVDQLAR